MTEGTTERPLETGWLPDTPIDDSLLRQFAFSQADVNVAWADAAGGRSERRDDVVLSDTGGPVPYYNQALLLRPVAGADDALLDDAEAWFAAGPSGRPVTLLSMWQTADLRARGWALVGHPMLVARGPWGDPRRPGDDEIVRELGPDEVGAFERVLVEGYPMPEAEGLPVGAVAPPGILERGVRLRVAVVDGVAVAAGAGYVGHGVVNLCGAAALPAARGKGAWGALVRARMADGPDLPAVAFTSDFSRPGFVHMGFLPLMRFTLWAR